MPGRNLSRFFTFSLIACVLFSYAAMFYDMGASRSKYETEAQARTNLHKSRAVRQVEHYCAGLPAHALSDCIEKEIKAARSNQREDYDLSAQLNMADAAWWMVAISAGTMLITTIALWYVRATLEATRDAVVEAEKSTAAALLAAEAGRAGNEISRESLHFQERAWIEIGLSLPTGLTKRDHNFVLPVFAVPKNVGRSPAKNVAISMAYAIYPQDSALLKEAMKEGIEFFRTQDRHSSGIVLFPNNESRQFDAVTIKKSEVDRYIKEFTRDTGKTPTGISLFLQIIVRYLTIFDDESAPVHITGRTFRIHHVLGNMGKDPNFSFEDGTIEREKIVIGSPPEGADYID